MSTRADADDLVAEPDADPPRRARGRKPRPRDAAAEAGPGSAAAILDAALGLIAARTYSTVTVKDIAAAAGVNVALIYYYYASKENLFLAILNAMLGEAAERFRALAAGDIRPEDALARWAEVHAGELANVQRFLRLCLDYSVGMDRTPVVDRVIAGYYEHEEGILRSIIQAGVQSGRFRPVDVYQVVRLASAMIDGILVRQLITPGGDPAREIAAAHRVLLDHLTRDPDAP